MYYRSLADLDRQLKLWIGDLPRDVDLIVGIPRSGMLAATLLALHLQKPVYALDAFLAGCGRSFSDRLQVENTLFRRILVLDDSVLTGRRMTLTKTALSNMQGTAAPQIQRTSLLYAAVYVAPGAEAHVDIFCEIVPHNRVFEWNLLHHERVLSNTCVDIDGVLCRDPTELQNDDGPEYNSFVATAPPIITPSVEIGWIVTCRLEKYRLATEKWLRHYGVKYRQLVMLDLPNAQARRHSGIHSEFKASVFKETRAHLFVESSLWQAREIARATRLPVFCTETSHMFNSVD